MRIIFIRHGEPDYTNDNLTEDGKIQAEAVANRLFGEGIAEIYPKQLYVCQKKKGWVTRR